MLVWNPHKESPIHDHPCNGCWVRVLENSVKEMVYEKNAENQLEVTADNLYEEGGVTWMHDIKGYHKIGNPNDSIAVTMHVYSPPFEISTILGLDGTQMTVNCSYDSEGGVPLNKNQQAIKASITDEVK